METLGDLLNEIADLRATVTAQAMRITAGECAVVVLARGESRSTGEAEMLAVIDRRLRDLLPHAPDPRTDPDVMERWRFQRATIARMALELLAQAQE